MIQLFIYIIVDVILIRIFFLRSTIYCWKELKHRWRHRFRCLKFHQIIVQSCINSVQSSNFLYFWENILHYTHFDSTFKYQIQLSNTATTRKQIKRKRDISKIASNSIQTNMNNLAVDHDIMTIVKMTRDCELCYVWFHRKNCNFTIYVVIRFFKASK